MQVRMLARSFLTRRLRDPSPVGALDMFTDVERGGFGALPTPKLNLRHLLARRLALGKRKPSQQPTGY